MNSMDDNTYWTIVWVMITIIVLTIIGAITYSTLEWQKYDGSIRLTCVGNGGVWIDSTCMWSAK